MSTLTKPNPTFTLPSTTVEELRKLLPPGWALVHRDTMNYEIERMLQLDPDDFREFAESLRNQIFGRKNL